MQDDFCCELLTTILATVSNLKARWIIRLMVPTRQGQKVGANGTLGFCDFGVLLWCKNEACERLHRQGITFSKNRSVVRLLGTLFVFPGFEAGSDGIKNDKKHTSIF